MAKKNEKEANEETIMEEPIASEQKGEGKPKKVNPKKETKTKIVEESVKRTLLDLIDNMEDSSLIFEKLMRHGYYEQYQEERDLKNKGYKITPTITKEEFEKIIN